MNAAKGRHRPGWLVGWLNSENDYFIFTIVNEESVKVVECPSRLTHVQIDTSRSNCPPTILSSRHLALFMYDLYDSRPLEVLGTLNYKDKIPTNANVFSQPRLTLRASITTASHIPKISFLDKPKVETQVILFSPPNPHEMQFFSLTPITLDLAASDHDQGRRRADSIVIDERNDIETARMDRLVQKMALHFPRRQGQPVQGAETLRASINQVSPLNFQNTHK